MSHEAAFLSRVQMRLRAVPGVVLVQVMLVVAVPGASPPGDWTPTGSMSSFHPAVGRLVVNSSRGHRETNNFEGNFSSRTRKEEVS